MMHDQLFILLLPPSLSLSLSLLAGFDFWILNENLPRSETFAYTPRTIFWQTFFLARSSIDFSSFLSLSLSLFSHQIRFQASARIAKKRKRKCRKDNGNTQCCRTQAGGQFDSPQPASVAGAGKVVGESSPACDFAR